MPSYAPSFIRKCASLVEAVWPKPSEEIKKFRAVIQEVGKDSLKIERSERDLCVHYTVKHARTICTLTQHGIDGYTDNYANHSYSGTLNGHLLPEKHAKKLFKEANKRFIDSIKCPSSEVEYFSHLIFEGPRSNLQIEESLGGSSKSYTLKHARAACHLTQHGDHEGEDYFGSTTYTGTLNGKTLTRKDAKRFFKAARQKAGE